MAVGGGAESKRMKIERQWSSSWSRLPEDIIFSIMNRLGYVGQLRFRAVCKSWREANIRGIKSADILPWRMAVDSRSCWLYDPAHNQKYTVETSITSSGIFTNSRVLASKYGWVLFAKGETYKEKYPYLTIAPLFLYTPFTNQIIHLPNLLLKSDDKATFSMPPDSPDCEIFVVRLDSDKKLLIRMCRPGETTWTRLALFNFFDTEDSSEKYGPAHNVEYVDGVLYISFEQIAVVAYNPKLADYKIYPYPSNKGEDIVYEYLFESDGNLLLYHDELDHLVFRLDRSQMKWIRIQNLDNRSLFLGTNSSLLIPVEETSESELVNTRHAVVCHCSMCTRISESFHLDDRQMEGYCWIQVPEMR